MYVDFGTTFLFPPFWPIFAFSDTCLSLYVPLMSDRDAKYNFCSGKWHCWQFCCALAVFFFSWLGYNWQIQVYFVKLWLTTA